MHVADRSHSVEEAPMTLENQVVIVTGAGQGIGKASAIAMARAGADVVAVDIDNDAASRTAEEIKAAGRRSLAIQADLGDLKDIDRMVSQTVAAYGRLDTLVNNAGVTRKASMMDLTEADWDRIHRVNSKGVFFAMQRAAREMIPRRSGRIVNMASVAGKGYKDSSNVIYAGSKGAVIAMTRLAAHSLAPHNINVNAVCPGLVLTALVDAQMQAMAQRDGISVDQAKQRAVASIPIKRGNEPEDIAAMVVFLASPGARNITGQSFNVDGGLIMD
jgi:NAD(P)-dependent dehydrogenase (short-subunit alcohol dehydrogenase family)